ncbi:MAG: hypothetical protein QOH81_2373 [Sphingomonadales bacterium]|jgi:hypothetical protein|nr:hypothetical protein [Sphingomonadales bacterium]
MMAALALAGLAVAPQERSAPDISASFECDMERGDFLARESERVSDDDRRYLPASWTLAIDRPGEHDDRTRYADPILGKPIDVKVLWGYRNRFFSGRGELIHSEFDWWGPSFTLTFTDFGEAMIWVEYFRTVPGIPRPHSFVVHGYGNCHEMVSFPVRKPS